MKLKPFQRATVEKAVEGLTSGSRRFLVADEVGLGKTLVAQGVIDQLATREGQHIDIFYVCSSLSIAHQNRKSLLEVLPKKERAAAKVDIDRLTLLPTRKLRRAGRFTLFTLTPSTMPGQRGHRAGRADERAVLWCLMEEFLDGARRQQKLKKAFSQRVVSWQRCLDIARSQLDRAGERNRSKLWKRFGKESRKVLDLGARASDRELLDELRAWSETDDDARELIRRLRYALSVAALSNLRPKLIILDEFQRFFDSVATEAEPDEDDEVGAGDLMRLILKRSHRPDSPAILMLSATPYRQYAAWADGGSAHASEFFQLLRFLSEEPEDVADIKRDFEQYARLLQGSNPGDGATLVVRDRLQTRLRRIIARTERGGLLAAPERSSRPQVREATLEPGDIQVFRHLCDSASREHRHMAEPLWSSIPFPMQMMDDKYVLRRDAKLVKPRGRSTVVRRKGVRKYAPLANPSPKLRALWKDLSWPALQLPWMPPTRPWWPLRGPFRSADDAPTKTLIFSRFRAVPRAVASSISYEVERRSFAQSSRALDYFARGRASQVDDLAASRSLHPQPRRSFEYSAGAGGDGKASPVVATFFPFPGLARLADPLGLVAESKHPVALEHAVERVIRRLEERLPIAKESHAMPWHAWVGAAEVALGTWDELWNGWERWLDPNSGCERRSDNAAQLAQRFRATAEKHRQQPIPKNHLRDLARHALLGPANVCLRAAERVFGRVEESAGRLARVIDVSSGGFRPYLDTPEFHAVLGKQRGKDGGHRDAVLKAVWNGNLEAVLDEYFATLQGLGATKPTSEREEGAFDDLETALGIRDSSVSVKSLSGREADFQLRCHAALPFGMNPKEVVAETTGKLRNDFLRVAFNSPFRPYVLVTTSLGQEGLDFHVYCDQLIHWDLPTNPVDIEQREGRISRYGGLGVRRSLARKAPALGPGRSPWHDIAAQQTESSGGLAPWWGTPDSQIRRTVYVPPLSKMKHDLEELLESLSLYRLTLGQADQEQLLRALRRRLADSDDPAALRAWLEEARIDLRPHNNTRQNKYVGRT